MKHVLVVNQFALPRSEAGGTRHIDLFSRLEQWRPLIVAGDRNHYSQNRYSTQDDRFRLLRVPRQSGGASGRLVGWIAFGIQAFTVCVTRRRVDLVLGSSPQPFAALAALAAARVRRRPFVLEVRDLWPASMVSAGRLSEGGLVHRLFLRLERLLARNARVVVCVTEGWEEHFEHLGVQRNRLVVVPNGTEPSDFIVDAPREELVLRYVRPGFTAVFAGAHGPKDGLDLIIDAARRLPQVNFLLVGSGPAKSEAAERARQEQLPNLEFREPVPKTELPALLRACDVGIHAVAPLSVFDHGMSPNKLFDYMAAELPVVSNAAGPLRRVLRDQECGRIGGPTDLADCVAAVYEASAEQRQVWGRRSGEILRERFSRRTAASLLGQTLDRAINSKTVAGVNA